MANLIIQENGSPRTTPAVHGEEITIATPCDCSKVTGVKINSVEFPFYDTLGNSLASITGLFAKDSLIRVMIDTNKTRAYILNAGTNASLESKLSAAEKNAKDYTDNKIKAIPAPDVSGDISRHNESDAAHSDIRTLINGKAASGHKHSTSDITSGTLAVAFGGTGATTAAAARTNLSVPSVAEMNTAITTAIGTAIGGTY